MSLKTEDKGITTFPYTKRLHVSVKASTPQETLVLPLSSGKFSSEAPGCAVRFHCGRKLPPTPVTGKFQQNPTALTPRAKGESQQIAIFQLQTKNQVSNYHSEKQSQ